MAQRPAFEFKRIEVRGDLQHVTAASVRAAIAGRLKGNYFTIRLDEARRLLETVPWVAQASVRRIWPNRLQVTLREHRALGAWNDGRLLSDRGELFVANVAEAEIFGPLPTFSGPDALARDVATRYYDFAAQLAALSLSVDGIDVSDRRSWAVRGGRHGTSDDESNSVVTTVPAPCSSAWPTSWRPTRWWLRASAARRLASTPAMPTDSPPPLLRVPTIREPADP